MGVCCAKPIDDGSQITPATQRKEPTPTGPLKTPAEFDAVVEHAIRDLTAGLVEEDVVNAICSALVMVSHNGTVEHRRALTNRALEQLTATFHRVHGLTAKEGAIRAISQLARCSRQDPHRLTATKHKDLLNFALHILASSLDKANVVILMHACDLMRYLIATDSDRDALLTGNAVPLLKSVIDFSVNLDGDNDLVKSAFQVLLSLGPNGENHVFEVVTESIVTHFFHSSVTTPAVASLMSISGDPTASQRIYDSGILSVIQKAVDVHKENTNIRNYSRRIASNLQHYVIGPSNNNNSTTAMNPASNNNTAYNGIRESTSGGVGKQQQQQQLQQPQQHITPQQVGVTIDIQPDPINQQDRGITNARTIGTGAAVLDEGEDNGKEQPTSQGVHEDNVNNGEKAVVDGGRNGESRGNGLGDIKVTLTYAEDSKMAGVGLPEIADDAHAEAVLRQGKQSGEKVSSADHHTTSALSQERERSTMVPPHMRLNSATSDQFSTHVRQSSSMLPILLPSPSIDRAPHHQRDSISQSQMIPETSDTGMRYQGNQVTGEDKEDEDAGVSIAEAVTGGLDGRLPSHSVAHTNTSSMIFVSQQPRMLIPSPNLIPTSNQGSNQIASTPMVSHAELMGRATKVAGDASVGKLDMNEAVVNPNGV